MSAEEFKYFFCYSHENLEFVLRLAKELRAEGANVWLDELDILGGQHWDSTVEEALKSCKGMIAVLSPEAVASRNVMDEVSYALDRGKLVVPVLIHSCDMPLRLGRLHYVDFTADYDTGFSKLLRALHIEQPAEQLESVATQEPVVQEPSLLKQSESTIGEQKSAKASGKRRTAKVLASIFVVALIVIVLIGILRPKTYSLTATPVGSIVKNPDQERYNHGEEVTLTATPDPNYRFETWSGDLSGSTNPATLVMDSDKSVTAVFDLKLGTIVTNSIGMKLVYIPAGSFMMGSPPNEEGRKDAEGPQHQVRISEGFWMGRTEVTQEQYFEVMKDKPWRDKQYRREEDPNNPNNPAVYVSWNDANEFCSKLSEQEGKFYRLPTEAEWEYACRAGTTTRFSFGDSDSSLGGYAWFKDNAREVAHQVGQKEPNPWGLYDMHGNVYDWCSDWYDEDYYSDSPSVDPNGPPSGDVHCMRGGSYDSPGSNLRCSFRHARAPDGDYYLGFRVVRSQP